MGALRIGFVTYIAAPPDEVWKALFDGESTRKYWQHENRSEWLPGSRWEHRRDDEDHTLDLVGRVLECLPSHRLVLTWAAPEDEDHPEDYSKVTLEVEPYMGVTRLTVTHEDLQPDSEMLEAVTDGWPKVLCS